MVFRSENLKEVILPCINGDELNNSPPQTPGRIRLGIGEWWTANGEW